MVRFLYVVSLSWSVIVRGQNLVPNPSFEKHTAVPCGFIGVLPPTSADSSYIYPDNIGNYLTDWYAPTSGTTDYWFFSDSIQRYRKGNDCANGAPLIDQQPTKARSGSGYVGLYMSYNRPGAVNYFPDYREYAQVRLIQPLKANVYYHISLFVQISYNSAYCTNQLGVLFTKQAITASGPINRANFGQPLKYIPQVKSNKYVCQSEQWVEISSCFLAAGGEQYLTIGNFSDDAHTEQQKTNIPFPGGTNVCYNLIDDVLVEEVNIPDYKPQANFLGPDTTLCSDQQLEVKIPINVGSVHWSSGDTSRTIKIDQSGMYIAEMQVKNCVLVDTINVNIVSKLVLPTDTILCQSDPYSLSIDPGIGKFTWEDGSNESSRFITQSGTYWIHSAYAQCIQADTIRITIITCPGFIPNVITPNHDGKNDRFIIDNITIIPWELIICNRWGAQIYYSEKYHNEWEAVGDPDGVYYYQLREPKSRRLIKGWVTVIR